MMKASELLKLAPRYHRWVDDLLGKHAAKVRPVSSCGFTKLPQFFAPETVAATRFVAVDVLPKVPWADFGLAVPSGMDNPAFTGITFRNTYFVLHREVKHEPLHFHEMVHVVQWQILGNDLFPLLYGLDVLAKGYRDCFLEVMARDVQGHFEQAPQPFRAELLVAAFLGTWLPGLMDKAIKGNL